MRRTSPILSLVVLLLIAVSAMAHDKVVVIPMGGTCDEPSDPPCDEPSVPTVTSAGGQVWMDRNLGASQIATSSMDTAAYGDLYQWGRGIDGHERRASATTTTLSTTNVPGHGRFIMVSSSPYDWTTSPNDNLWQGVFGTNNPCPCGFRLPTEAEWEVERTSWSSNDEAGAFASPLKLVDAGNHPPDSVTPSPGSAYYWSSTVDGSYSYLLYFTHGSASMISEYRAWGSSVRCIKD